MFCTVFQLWVTFWASICQYVSVTSSTSHELNMIELSYVVVIALLSVDLLKSNTQNIFLVHCHLI